MPEEKTKYSIKKRTAQNSLSQNRNADKEAEDDFSVNLEKMQKILAKFKPSAEPKCPIYEKCGGCQLQQLSYEQQLVFKRKVVVEDIHNIGGLANTPVLPVKGAVNPWEYRNKTQMPLGTEKGKVVLGCYEQGTHRIIDSLSCDIQQQENNELINAVREVISKLNIPIYNEDRHTGILRHVVGRVGLKGETMLVLVTTDTELRNEKQLVNLLRKRLPKLVSVHQNIQTYHNSVVMGRETRLLWGKASIKAQLGKLRFEVSPRSSSRSIQLRLKYYMIQHWNLPS